MYLYPHSMAAFAVREFALCGLDYYRKIFCFSFGRSRCIPSTIRCFCYELSQFDRKIAIFIFCIHYYHENLVFFIDKQPIYNIYISSNSTYLMFLCYLFTCKQKFILLKIKSYPLMPAQVIFLTQ